MTLRKTILIAKHGLEWYENYNKKRSSMERKTILIAKHGLEWYENHNKKHAAKLRRWRVEHSDVNRALRKKYYYRDAKDPVKVAQRRAYNRQWNKNVKIRVLEHYGGNPPRCVCCNESILQFLTIDHTNNDGSLQRKTNPFTRHHLGYWLWQNGYPNGYQVLCWNCNVGKGLSGGQCPHKCL